MKNFNFVKNRKIFFIFTALVVVAGIVSFFVQGFNFDIEFVGGTEISYVLEEGKAITDKDEEAIKKLVIEEIGKENFSSLRVIGDNKDTVVIRTTLVEKDDVSWEDAGKAVNEAVKKIYPDMSVVSESDGNSIFKLFKDPEVDEQGNVVGEAKAAAQEDVTAIETALEGVVPAVSVKLEQDGNVTVSFDVKGVVSEHRQNISESIKELYPDSRWESTDTVSAEVSDNLKKTAIISAVLAIVLMLVYIAFRFEISSALAAVVCLAHDIFVMVVAYSVFQIPVSSTIIATMLTILGYSINATIIIFDRVRENTKQMPQSVSFADKVDSGIKSTLMRSINTSFTTLITIGLIYFLGVTSIKNFALPIIVGILAGAYSSICLSGNLWVLFRGKKK